MATVAGKALPAAKRWLLIQDWLETGNKAAVARRNGLARNTVDKWVTRFQASGDAQVAATSGGTHKLTPVAAGRAFELLLDGQQRSAGDVALVLEQEGLTKQLVHRTTVARRAKQHGRSIKQPIHAVSGPPAKLITKATRTKRLDFALQNKTASWKSVMFTDRKRFYLRYPGTGFKPSEWRVVGDKRRANRVSNPSCLNIYVGITAYGVTASVTVAGTTKHKSTFVTQAGQPSRNITKNEYKVVVQEQLLPQGRAIFRNRGIFSWTFQQDNDPSHSAAAQLIQEYNAKHNTSIKLLKDWPPNSPDLNPVENFWGWLQAKVNAIQCNSFEEFKAEVVKQIKQAPKELLLKYYESMPRRMAKVIEMEGGETKY
jgi:transposase-like protein